VTATVVYALLSKQNQLRRRYTQCGCKPKNYTHCRLPLTAFNHADERAVNVRGERELLLRQTDFLSNRTQHLPER